MFLTKFCALILVIFAISVGLSLPKNHTEPQPKNPRKDGMFSRCCSSSFYRCCGKCVRGRCKGFCAHICPSDVAPVDAADYFYGVCDDLIQVYMDGKYQPPVGGGQPWPTESANKYAIPPGTKVIAVECLDVEQSRRGLIGSTDYGVVTNNADWKCTDTRESNWQTVDYDDIWWGNPVENYLNGHGPFGLFPKVSLSAYWIWTGFINSTYPVGPNAMFCRHHYTDPDPASRQLVPEIQKFPQNSTEPTPTTVSAI